MVYWRAEPKSRGVEAEGVGTWDEHRQGYRALPDAHSSALAGCSSDPAPGPPTPLPVPSPTPVPTISVASLAAAITPFPTVSIELLRSNALAATRSVDLAAPLHTVVDGTYCTPAWRESAFPASIAIPVQPVRGDLLLEWNSSGTNDYIAFPGAPTYGLPASYTIATSADSTDGRDGTWRQVVSVADNTARTREHRFPLRALAG